MEAGASVVVQPNVPNRRNFRWHRVEDDVLVNCLSEEVLQGGKRCGNGWRQDALKHVAEKVRVILNGDAVTTNNVINRLKTLKCMCVTAKEAESQSGFFMTAEGKIEADDISWEAYVKAKTLCINGVRKL